MDLNAFSDAIASAAPEAPLRRRMGKVTAIGSNYTISVQIAGSTTTITGVRYFNHYAPKVGSQVWLDTDGRDWIAIGAIAGLGGAVPSVKVMRTADLSIATGAAYTTVAWQAADFDPWGMWTSGTNVVVPLTGRYLITGQATFNAGATLGSYRGVQVRTNGSTGGYIGWTQTDYASSSGVSVWSGTATGVRHMVAGDYVTMHVHHNNAAALTLSSTAINDTHMTVTYLGSDA